MQAKWRQHRKAGGSKAEFVAILREEQALLVSQATTEEVRLAEAEAKVDTEDELEDVYDEAAELCFAATMPDADDEIEDEDAAPANKGDVDADTARPLAHQYARPPCF